MREYITIPSSFKDLDFYNDKPFNRPIAWIDLLLYASTHKIDTFMKGRYITLQKGQQARSEGVLSNQWGWSVGKVRRFLKKLETHKMITQQKDNLTSIITICDYDNIYTPAKNDTQNIR